MTNKDISVPREREKVEILSSTVPLLVWQTGINEGLVMWFTAEVPWPPKDPHL